MPVYNERTTIRELLERVLAVPLRKEILVVDDGSTDGTNELLRAEVEKRQPEVRLITRERNEGKGAAIRAGLADARGEYVIIQDGDLEYDPQDYVPMLLAARRQGVDVVYGTRFTHGWPLHMRWPNRAANFILSRMVRALYGAPLTDEATCYKLFKRDVLLSLPLVCRRFEFCPEVTAKTLRRGHRVVEVPIHYVSRSLNEGKKIRWTDGIVAIWTLLRYRFWR
jgi:dolichol-phosphate mannosyltransferase